MDDTETVARLKLKNEKRIKVIMEQARKREAEYLERARLSKNRKAHYEMLAAEQIKLAHGMCEELMQRLKNLQHMKNDRKARKILGDGAT